MRNGLASHGARCVLAALLLAAGLVALDCGATPFLSGHKGWLREAPRDDAWSAADVPLIEGGLLAAERWWSLAPGLNPGEIRADAGTPNDIFYGPGAYADLPVSFENGFSLRESLSLEVRRNGQQSSDLGLGSMIDTTLRSAWDAIADDGNTASFSLAGLELSLTLRGDQRALTVNGYDLLPALVPVTQIQDTPMQADGDTFAATSVQPLHSAAAPDGNLVSHFVEMFEGVRGVVLHPLTLFFGVTFLITWLTVRVMQALRERKRAYRRYRRG